MSEEENTLEYGIYLKFISQQLEEPSRKFKERRTCPIDLKGRRESTKDPRKSCCHCIKFTITTFLTAFMWRRNLNSETLVITTHREPEEMSNGTDTQVKSQMNDKCKVKMIQRELYNIKNHLWKGIGKILKKEDNKLIDNCMWKRSIDIKVKLLGLRIFSHLFLQFHLNCLWNCDNCSPNLVKPSFPIYFLQIYCLGPLHYKFGPQI